MDIFIGYAKADVNVRESMGSAADKLAELAETRNVVTWEDLHVDGKLIINDVLQAIDNSQLGIFDVTSMNENVLFELGYTVGQGKSVVITKDGDNLDSDKLFREFALLTTTGYTTYLNSGDLYSKLSALVAAPPPPLLKALLGETKRSLDWGRMLYIPSMKEDEPSRKLSRLLDSYTDLPLETLDIDEYGTSPLAWLVQQVWLSDYFLAHLTPKSSYLADTSNRRVSLLAGIALGLSKSIRVVSWNRDDVALDYRDLRIAYATSKDVVTRVEEWLSGLPLGISQGKTRVRRHMSIDLSALRFGSHVAETDADGLDRYFVETRDYLDVVDAAAVIFTGRKGTGKTANMLQAAESLRTDARNLVCVIKPASYELESLSILLKRVTSSHVGDYIIEGVWKYLLYTEVAATVVRHQEQLAAGIASGSAIDKLRISLNRDHAGVDATFSVRLERLIDNLNVDLGEGLSEDKIAETRAIIGRSLYAGNIKELRALLTRALEGKNRVAVLIDNLDKAWERGADLGVLAKLILGLLTAVGRVQDEFTRDRDSGAVKVKFTLTAFLRSDIYSYVRDHAREPDKITTAEIEWRDKTLLARVLEDRFLAARTDSSKASDLWDQYFVSQLGGVPSKDYILGRVQPRPRDLVFFANAAVAAATNSKHALIGQDDVDRAEVAYSQFAYEALLVEGVAVGIDMDGLLMNFIGEADVLSRSEIQTILIDGGVNANDIEERLDLLRQNGFLGIEVADQEFDFGGTAGEIRRADIRSSKLVKKSGRERRYTIHPSYRRHLLIDE